MAIIKARFEVSTKGMRELQSGREPWQLAKELVSNAWDETTTICEVTLKSISSHKAKLTVRDDGAGFSDINDAWTLMGHTPKRLNPTVRGRFNIGEKEILSVADEATIRTSGKIIRFPKTGGRTVHTDKTPFKGTEIVCILPWGTRQVEATIDKLQKLLVPNGMQYRVNGKEISWREPQQIIEATLETVLQDSPNEPMRTTRRKTTLELYPAPIGILYEMGIPIHEIECPYLINVMQKVPMPPNRDVVRDSYLQDIYTVVLNNTYDDLKEPSATWVRLGVEDKEAAPDAIKAVMTQRYGDKVALWSTDHRSNEKALSQGYELVHGRTLSSSERESFQSAGLEHASTIFPTSWGEAEEYPQDKWTPEMWQAVNYAKRLAKELLGIELTVSMYSMPQSSDAADYLNGHLRFNVVRLGKNWFKTINYIMTKTYLHEFSHNGSKPGEGHGWEFARRLEDLAGKAVHLALDKPEIFRG